MFIIFALSITKQIKKKKHINLRDHQNSAIDIAADTVSPVINDKRIFFSIGSKNLSFWDDRKIFSPVTANSSASNIQILVVLSCPQVSGNWQKSKIYYMAAAAHNEDFQGLVSF